MNLLHSKYGCWIVGGAAFASKIAALKYANQTNQGSVSYYYHSHVWDKFDRTLLGKVPLPLLYKERAQQLRDKYDYLVLHYSGGSDSHNILRTFLDNDIRLDEVYVRWPKQLMDMEPDAHDTSAKNALSEWHLTIKPTLEWLGKKYPQIHINVQSYTSNLSKEQFVSTEKIEQRILELRSSRMSLGSLAQRIDPDTELRTGRGKVGNIFGIEKPILILDNGKLYMRFADSMFESGMMLRGMAEESVEAFYAQADLPLLPMEQAYQAALYFKHHPEARTLLYSDPNITPQESNLIFEAQTNLLKKVLYSHTWDFNRFQVGKPNVERSDWYSWMYTSTELSSLRNNFHQAMNNIAEDLDPRFLLRTTNTNLMKPISSRAFYLMDLE